MSRLSEEERSSRLRSRTLQLFLVTLTVSSGILVVSSLWTGLIPDSGCSAAVNSGPSNHPQKTIAVIDQLSIDDPNPDFVTSVNESARNAGYVLDYYLPSAASLDSFFKLPYMGYSMIILRTHGVAFSLDGRSYIVTSNPYDAYTRVGDQLKDRLGVVDVNGQKYFAITPKGIEDMCGSFTGTTILAMFCSGGQWTSLAQAFVHKGAEGYVGWNNSVTASHTDLAFERLTALLLTGTPAVDGIHEVMETIGPDPSTGAQLTLFPS